MKSKTMAWLLFGVILASCGLANAQDVPQLINYQGRLIDHSGAPVDGSTLEVRFELVDGDTPGSSLLWGETQAAVSVSKGIYSVLLGSVNPITPSVFSGSTVYLEVTVRGEVFTPRQRIASVPFAMVAGDCGGGDYYSKAEVDAMIAALQAQIDGNSVNIATNSATLGVVEEKLEPVSVTKKGDTVSDLIFTGVNVHVRSGTGATDGDTTGYGNLIVGYNENSSLYDRSGSHNIIVGKDHGYSSYGGLVAGQGNRILGVYASVSGGSLNVASGSCSTVAGGGGYVTNHAFANYSAIIGGYGNLAGDSLVTDHSVGENSTLVGGDSNLAYGMASTVSGGFDNRSAGYATGVSGGYHNLASGDFAVVSGGYNNVASGDDSAVLGGRGNGADGNESTVSGGYQNHANGNYSSVSGGNGHTITGYYNWQAGTLFEDQ